MAAMVENPPRVRVTDEDLALYRRELEALAEGRPLKQWTWAPEAVSTRGY